MESLIKTRQKTELRGRITQAARRLRRCPVLIVTKGIIAPTSTRFYDGGPVCQAKPRHEAGR
jgi:hypothetical protein